jgi:uncharacterized membrane protein
MRKQSSPGLGGLNGRPWLSCLLAAAIGACLPLQAASAQPATTVQRSAKGASGKDIQIGVYLNVLANCKSGPLPAIQMIVPPENGSATVKRAKVSLTNYKNCMALEVPAFIGVYRSKPDFTGSDHLTLSVSYPNGRTETQQITVTVGAKQNRGRDI